MQDFANRTVPVLAANHAYLFFDRSFDNQGFTDRIFIPWKATKSGKRKTFGRDSQGILIGTGALRSSLHPRYKHAEARVTAGGAKVPYGVIHNNGGTLTVRITLRSVVICFQLRSTQRNL